MRKELPWGLLPWLENQWFGKSTLFKHMEVLRAAGLIQSERRGVELHNRLRLHDVRPKFEPLVVAILQAYKLKIEANQADS